MSLLTNYDSDPELKSFVDKYDFYLYPVVNPDGTSADNFPHNSHNSEYQLTMMQGSHGHRPTTVYGVKTDRRLPRAPASATTSTATGTTCGTL